MNKRKKIVLLVALCLIFMFITAARYSAERPPQWLLMIASDTFGWRLSDSSAVIRMQVDTDGSLNVYNAAGTKTWGISTAGLQEVYDQNIVVIDTLAELSTWSGAAAGSSYFQMAPDMTYIVDVQALARSSENVTLTATGTSGFGAGVVFSAVTAHLPLATANTDKTVNKVILANTSSYTGISSGTTTVQIWPAPLTGATQFRTTSTYLSQNMLGATTSGSSAFTVNVTGDRSLTHVGGSYEFMLFNNSAVSASPISPPYNFGAN